MLTGKTRQQITGQIKEAAGRIGTGVLTAVVIAVAALLVSAISLIAVVRGARHGGA